MRNSTVGLIIGIVILFLGFNVQTIYFIGCIQWRDDVNTVQNATRNFVDSVIDTGEIAEDTLADFNLALASCQSTYAYKIYHEEIVTNPDPTTGDPNATKTTWIYTDDLDNWNTGDFITVEVKQVSENFFQRISSSMLSMVFGNRDCTLSGMVR